MVRADRAHETNRTEKRHTVALITSRGLMMNRKEQNEIKDYNINTKDFQRNDNRREPPYLII